MTKHDLFTPQNCELNYPHCTQIKNGIIDIVTNPDKKVKVGDVVYADGDASFVLRDQKVVEILEERPARGQHFVGFIPVFQKLKTK